LILQIPVRSDIPAYEFQITLEGTPYRLSFRYNRRRERWAMDIKNQQGDSILSGIPILVGMDLTSRFRAEGGPPGRFFAVDSSNQDLPPTEADLGNRVLLYYEEANSG
jgi:hypothetical protein